MTSMTTERLGQPQVHEEAGQETEAVLPLERGMSKPQILLIEILGSVVAAGVGIGAFLLSGLYAAADAGVVTYVLGAFIASWFVLNFRVGLFMK
jgi:hypothetical protein